MVLLNVFLIFRFIVVVIGLGIGCCLFLVGLLFGCCL